MDTWCEVIYNGMLLGPQGHFWVCHMMEMSEISPVEVHSLIKRIIKCSAVNAAVALIKRQIICLMHLIRWWGKDALVVWCTIFGGEEVLFYSPLGVTELVYTAFYTKSLRRIMGILKFIHYIHWYLLYEMQ